MFDQLTQLVLEIFKTNGQLVRWGDDFTSEFGISSAKWQVLGAIAMTDQPLSSPQIAYEMGISRQGAQKQLNALMAEELIEPITNPHNKRSPLYRPTEGGQIMFDQINQKWMAHTQNLSNKLQDYDLEQAIQLLQTIRSLHSLGEAHEAHH